MKKQYKILIILLIISAFSTGIFNLKIPLAGALAPSNRGALAPSNITIKNKNLEKLYYFDPIPDFTSTGTDKEIDAYVYKMGDIIQGELNEIPASSWVASLQTLAGIPIDTLWVSGGKAFSLVTGNVSYDGKYKIVATDSLTSPTWTAPAFVYVKYNIQITNSDIKRCSQTSTVAGYITRGSNQATLVPLAVGIASPEKKLVAQYDIPQNSSGQFTLAFPETSTLGYYYLFVSDGYPSISPDNDAIIYYFIPNFLTTNWTLKEIIPNSILYNDEEGTLSQSIVFYLVDQDGEPVTGEKNHFFIGMSWNSHKVKEISKGIYKIYDGRLTGNSVSIYVRDVIQSNIITKNLQKLSFFNPYIDIDAEYAQTPYGAGPYFDYTLNKNIFDKLPVSMGNSLEIRTGVYPIPNLTDPGNKKFTLKDNYYIYKTDLSFSSSLETHKIGPDSSSVWNDPSINLTTKPVYFVRNSANVSVSVSSIIWERANQDKIPTWQLGTPDPLNACCAKKTTYTFQFLKGEDSIPCNISVTPEEVTIKEEQDLSVYTGSINPIIHIYMVNKNTGEKVQDALSVSYKMGRERKVLSDLWYNPLHISGTNIATLPVAFGYDDNIDVMWKSGSIIFSNVSFEKITVCPVCPRTIIVEVFAKAQNNTYPLCSIIEDAVTVNPVITKLTASYEIRPEGGTPTKILLAGVKESIYITTKFTNSDLFWSIYYNEKPVEDYGLGYSINQLQSDSFVITFNKPFPFDENFSPNILGIKGEAFNTGRTASETIDLKISTKKPEQDSVPPEIHISEPKNGATTNVKFPFFVQGNITDNQGILEILINGQKTLTLKQDGSFKELVQLEEGENSISISAKDYAGNESKLEIIVILDTIPPELEINAPSETTDGVIEISGQTEKDAIVKYNSQILQNNNGNFAITLPLKIGENSFSFTAEDKLGNQILKVVRVTRKEKTLILVTIGSPYIFVNSQIKEIDAGRGTVPVIKDGRTLLPIRAIIEAIGGEVSWDAALKKVTIKLKDVIIELWIGNPQAKVKEINVYIDPENHDVKPEIVNGRTMLPLRFIAESLGCEVNWNAQNKSITITYIN
jgi:hypothetical protein